MSANTDERKEFHKDWEYNRDKVDEMVLALLHLTSFEPGKSDPDVCTRRAWKGQDWDVLNRLYDKGYIGDPMGKTKSVAFTKEGTRVSEELFYRHFGKAR